MKKIASLSLVVVLALLMVGTASAQSKMSVSVGPDVLIPIGTFGDAYSIGFGGTARGQYDVMPNLGVGLTVGYFTFSYKGDVPAGVSKPSFSGVPVRVFGKYYFMPAGKQLTVYGIMELGFFFSSVTVPSVSIPGFGTVGGGSASSTDFSYAPGVGVELPAGSLKLDFSVRYDGIATSGSSTGNLGVRAAVNFAI